MDLVSRHLTSKAFLSHPRQILTSLDCVVIKWKNRRAHPSHHEGPRSLQKTHFLGTTEMLLVAFLSEPLKGGIS